LRLGLLVSWWRGRLADAEQEKLDRLRTTGPNGFPSFFELKQVGAHKEALSLFQLYARSGADAKLRDGRPKRHRCFRTISRWRKICAGELARVVAWESWSG